MVMEKSGTMTNWQKALESCDQSWNFTNSAPEFYQICAIGIPHFSFLFLRHVVNVKFEQLDRNGKWGNGHGKVLGVGGGGLQSLWKPYSRQCIVPGLQTSQVDNVGRCNKI